MHTSCSSLSNRALGATKEQVGRQAPHLDLVVLVVVFDLGQGFAGHCLRQPSPVAPMQLHKQEQRSVSGPQ